MLLIVDRLTGPPDLMPLAWVHALSRSTVVPSKGTFTLSLTTATTKLPGSATRTVCCCRGRLHAVCAGQVERQSNGFQEVGYGSGGFNLKIALHAKRSLLWIDAALLAVVRGIRRGCQRCQRLSGLRKEGKSRRQHEHRTLLFRRRFMMFRVRPFLVDHDTALLWGAWHGYPLPSPFRNRPQV